MGLLAEYKALLYQSNLRKEQEIINVQEGRLPWGVYGSSLHSYSERFSQVLNKGDGISSFETLFKQRKDTQGECRVLELAGDGAFMEDNPYITQGVAVTLNDFNPIPDLFKKVSSNKEVIEGNLLQKQSWNKILSAYPKKDFDFILFAPVCGWETLAPHNSEAGIYSYIYTRKCWELLNRQNGELFIHFDFFNYFGFRKFKMILNALNSEYRLGINYRIERQQLRLEKREHNTNRLPLTREILSRITENV